MKRSSNIIGSAETNVTVTVNEAEATRQAYYWYHRLTVDNLYNPIYTQVVVEAIYDPGTNDPYVVSSETGSVFVAESPEVFTYDDDGNMLSDGRFEYTWDGENRLIAVTTAEGLPEDMPVVHVEFEYDYMSRRVGKTVYQWDAGITNWTETESSTFLYDGWNLVQERSASGGNSETNHYVHGLDLSGSLQGAGGIGGLLATVHGTNAYFATYDANGNVSEYVDASGDIAAHYEYSPFGETIVSTGPMAKDFAHRFSTKYTDDETGLLYYGYRFYSPEMGRWVNRDPIGEEGGWNLYGHGGNAILNNYDYLGLSFTWHSPDIERRTSRNLHPDGSSVDGQAWCRFVVRPRVWGLHGTRSDGCCDLTVKGDGYSGFWYYAYSTTAFAHEMEHIKGFERFFYALRDTVKRYERRNISCEKAKCYEALMRIAERYTEKAAYAHEFQRDCDEGQRRACRKAEEFRNKVLEKRGEYSSKQAECASIN